MTGSEVAVRTQAEIESRERVNARLAQMFDTIPEAGENVVEDMLAQLVGIESLEQIDSLWNSNGLGNYAGWVLELRALKKLPSDISGTCGWFMAVDAVVCATGEAVTITTSATLVMVQLIVIHGKGWFPVKVIPRFSERPTKNGYHPMHLDLHRGEPLQPAPQTIPGARAQRIAERVRAAQQARREDAEEADDGQAPPLRTTLPEEPAF